MVDPRLAMIAAMTQNGRAPAAMSGPPVANQEMLPLMPPGVVGAPQVPGGGSGIPPLDNFPQGSGSPFIGSPSVPPAASSPAAPPGEMAAAPQGSQGPPQGGPGTTAGGALSHLTDPAHPINERYKVVEQADGTLVLMVQGPPGSPPIVAKVLSAPKRTLNQMQKASVK